MGNARATRVACCSRAGDVLAEQTAGRELHANRVGAICDHRRDLCVLCRSEIGLEPQHLERGREPGREAFLAGRMPKKLYSASPSSPVGGVIAPIKAA